MIGYNPTIVTDGLVLYLDAANGRSFPGSGTTWSDLSGNGNNGTLINGPTYSTGSLGSFIFDGSNDYVNLGNTLDISTGDYTVSFFTKIDGTSTSFMTLFSKKSVAASGAGYATYYSGSTKKLLWSNGNGSIAQEYFTSSIIPLDVWINVVCIRSVSSPTKGYFYINGDLYPITNNPTGLDVSNSYDYTIGKNSTGSYYLNGSISNLKFYNRALSEDEIKQNFNATRGRFGI